MSSRERRQKSRQERRSTNLFKLIRLLVIKVILGKKNKG